MMRRTRFLFLLPCYTQSFLLYVRPLFLRRGASVDSQEKKFLYTQKILHSTSTSSENSTESAGKDGNPREELQNYSSFVIELCSEALEGALVANEKQYNSLLKEKDKAAEYETRLSRAKLILSNLQNYRPGSKTLEVIDWEKGEEFEIELDTKNYSSAKEESEAIFAQCKKLKRGTNILDDLIEVNGKVKNILLSQKGELQKIEDSGCDDSYELFSFWKVLYDSSKKTRIKIDDPLSNDEYMIQLTSEKPKKSSGQKSKASDGTTFRNLVSPSGLPVVVGRNRRDNEAICFKVAKGDDIWMHARGYPGAHILIKVRRGSTQPTDDDLQFAANLAAFYSEARTEVNVIITVAEPKHILKPRGAPLGAVKLRQESKSLVGRPQDVPEDLKLAREESGFGDYEHGRMSKGGKARSKKRNEEALKKKLEQKKARRRNT